MRVFAQRRADLVACGLSAACVVHCLALPVAASVLPALAIASEAEWVHWVIAALAAPLAIFAFLPKQTPWHLRGLALVGVGFLIAGAMEFPSHDWDTPNTVTGALLLAVAHTLNAFRHGRGKHRTHA